MVDPAVSESPAANVSISAARLAIASSAAAFVMLLSLHLLSPEYSPAWRMISEYANGRYSWVLSLMFVAYGASSLSLAFALRSISTTTWRGRFGLVLLTVSAIGQLSAAQFDLQQVVLHELAGVLGIACLPPAAILISRTLVETPRWEATRNWIMLTANLTWISVVVWIGTFMLMVATFAYALGGSLPTTPPDELPSGVIALVGWTNRLMVISAWVWVVTVAWQAIKLGNQEAAPVQSGVLSLQAASTER